MTANECTPNEGQEGSGSEQYRGPPSGEAFLNVDGARWDRVEFDLTGASVWDGEKSHPVVHLQVRANGGELSISLDAVEARVLGDRLHEAAAESRREAEAAGQLDERES